MERKRFHLARRSFLSNRALAPWVLLMLTLFCFTAAAAQDQKNCRVYMYKNDDRGQLTDIFSTHDKIHVHVDFDSLSKGPYAFQAEWYNAFGELQDTSHFAFSLPDGGHYAVESWLKISKAGFLTRLFSASETTGYNVKFYGKWQIRIYLNGDEMALKTFEVQ